MRTVVRAVSAMLLLTCVACTGATATSTPTPASGTPAAPTQTPEAPARTAAPATPLPACLPRCVTGRLTRPGLLGGDYKTRNFFGGQLTVTVPEGWFGYEDSTSELSIGPKDSEDARLELWLDVHVAADVRGTRDQSVDLTTEAMTAWIVSNPNLDILRRTPATIGGLAAEAIDWARSAGARNSDPDCPAELRPCVVEFGYPEWDGAFTEGGPFRSRLVIAKAAWSGGQHTLYAMLWATSADAFASFEAHAMALVEGARLPAGVGS
jgi:hypothetical protein